MKRFEYKYFRFTTSETLNDYGQQGWELVCMHLRGGFFKREVNTGASRIRALAYRLGRDTKTGRDYDLGKPPTWGMIRARDAQIDELLADHQRHATLLSRWTTIHLMDAKAHEDLVKDTAEALARLGVWTPQQDEG